LAISGTLVSCFLEFTSHRVIMEEQFIDEILKDTFTLDAFRKRFQALRLRIEGSVYNSGNEEKKEEPENQTAPAKDQEKWLESFDGKLLSGITNDQFNAIKQHVDAFINSTPPLAIYFVFSLEEAQVKQVGEWLRKNLNNPKLVFDIKVDPGLIGGCAVVYKGVYRDYSLKGKISQNREQLVGEFRKYFKQ